MHAVTRLVPNLIQRESRRATPRTPASRALHSDRFDDSGSSRSKQLRPRPRNTLVAGLAASHHTEITPCENGLETGRIMHCLRASLAGGMATMKTRYAVECDICIDFCGAIPWNYFVCICTCRKFVSIWCNNFILFTFVFSL